MGTLENVGITCGEDNLDADCRSLPYATELLMSSTSRLLSYDNPRYRKRGARVTSGSWSSRQHKPKQVPESCPTAGCYPMTEAIEAFSKSLLQAHHQYA
ncbi:predicted protein [Botrytis cinerea T4]|uniref:Uncharacterized protein n=1 Tax=Botryotinia fuckeliana (strain T4) TaxID=999810 RepID=G2XSA1_BOTF4|nr:predicted protein [Botrytis cinerea T4]